MTYHMKMEDHIGWKGENVGYTGAHMRLFRYRGRATSHVCPCGQPAQEWAYDKTGPPGDTASYVAMCRPCHRKMDAPEPKTHCPYGHERKQRKSGTWVCPTCHREREAKRWRDRRAQSNGEASG